MWGFHGGRPSILLRFFFGGGGGGGEELCFLACKGFGGRLWAFGAFRVETFGRAFQGLHLRRFGVEGFQDLPGGRLGLLRCL